MLIKYQAGNFYPDFSMRAPLIFGIINGDVQSDTATLEFKNREQLEYFHSIFIRLQQEINLSG